MRHRVPDMAAPMRPQRNRDDRLLIADVKVDYPKAFVPGDRYTVEVILNRRLDEYEERVCDREIRLQGFTVEGDRLSARQDIEDLDLEDIADFVAAVASRAVELRREAKEEQERLRAKAVQARDVLRPPS